jgi:hypothetical protein
MYQLTRNVCMEQGHEQWLHIECYAVWSCDLANCSQMCLPACWLVAVEQGLDRMVGHFFQVGCYQCNRSPPVLLLVSGAAIYLATCLAGQQLNAWTAPVLPAVHGLSALLQGV